MIPVIDLGLGEDAVYAQLIEAYERVGFAYVVNHGVNPTLVGDVFDASQELHSAEPSVKAEITRDTNHRGYIALDTSVDRASEIEAAKEPNHSESFMMMQVLASKSGYLVGENQWPAISGFREAVEAYNTVMTTLGARVINLFGRALGDNDALSPAFDSPTTWLRLLRYPPRPSSASSRRFGSAPHVDFGAVTLLAQDDVGGLQVRDPSGEWIDVEPMPGAFIMNTGEMLHRWSNGRLLATPHRVINPAGNERFSCAFFFDPALSTMVKPLASCVDEEHPVAFSPVLFEQYVRNQLESTYDQRL